MPTTALRPPDKLAPEAILDELDGLSESFSDESRAAALLAGLRGKLDDLAAENSELERENGDLNDEISGLQEKVEDLAAARDRATATELILERWHNDTHRGVFRFCSEQPCHDIERS